MSTVSTRTRGFCAATAPSRSRDAGSPGLPICFSTTSTPRPWTMAMVSGVSVLRPASVQSKLTPRSPTSAFTRTRAATSSSVDSAVFRAKTPRGSPNHSRTPLQLAATPTASARIPPPSSTLRGAVHRAASAAHRTAATTMRAPGRNANFLMTACTAALPRNAAPGTAPGRSTRRNRRCRRRRPRRASSSGAARRRTASPAASPRPIRPRRRPYR